MWWGGRMISRLAFDAEIAHAIRVRRLTLTEVARRANLSPATVSSAISGRPVNLTTALRLTRMVSACPVVPELERWGRDPARVSPRAHGRVSQPSVVGPGVLASGSRASPVPSAGEERMSW